MKFITYLQMSFQSIIVVCLVIFMNFTVLTIDFIVLSSIVLCFDVWKRKLVVIMDYFIPYSFAIGFIFTEVILYFRYLVL